MGNLHVLRMFLVVFIAVIFAVSVVGSVIIMFDKNYSIQQTTIPSPSVPGYKPPTNTTKITNLNDNMDTISLMNFNNEKTEKTTIKTTDNNPNNPNINPNITVLQQPQPNFGSFVICNLQQTLVVSVGDTFSAIGILNWDDKKGKWESDTKYYGWDESNQSPDTSKITSGYIFGSGTDAGDVFADTTAVSVGTVGVKSMILSDDALRLYVAYQSSVAGTSVSSNVSYSNTTSRIQVFTQPGTTQGSDWVHACNVFDTCSYGNYASSQFTNTFTEKKGINTDMGAFTQSVVTKKNNYLLFTNSSSEAVPGWGFGVNIFEENQDDGQMSYTLLTRLHLPVDTSTQEDRYSFGKSFAASESRCIVSFGSHELDTDNRSKSNRLAYFLYTTKYGWVFRYYLYCPSDFEYFGTSVLFVNDGHTLLVGSPSVSSVKYSGRVYLYQLNDRDAWVVNQTIQDPSSWTSTYKFGWFLNKNTTGTIFTVTGNQNTDYNNIQQQPEDNGMFKCNEFNSNCTLPFIAFYYLEYLSKDDVRIVHEDQVYTIYQPLSDNPTGKTFVDPTFGADVYIPNDTDKQMIIVGSNLNKEVYILKQKETN